MFENIRLAFQGIWSHKMRSFLTMLGIIIGIASIIAIVSTIKGTSEQIKDNLIGSGNNTVNITLSQGDSAYSVDYYDGGSSGSTPLLSQSLKDEVLKADHVENATFFYRRTDYIGKIIEIGPEPYTVVGVVRQSSDSLPNMDTPNDFDSYYESVIGTVMIPNKCWPIS